MVKFQPVIKWSGSKRSQCEEIIKYFPRKMSVYYEPFIGGGSMMRHLLDNRDIIDVGEIECSDLNADLINLWNMIKDSPDELSEYYSKLWHELNDQDDDKDRKRAYFNKVRDRYNSERNPADFLVIMRWTTNGMPRYSSHKYEINGIQYQNFNNSFHITRNGIVPESLDKIIHDWSTVLNENKVNFIHRSYTDVVPKSKESFCYFDPPYANTKGMYLLDFNNETLYDYLRELVCPYVMSYDGISGDVDNTVYVPVDLYDEHIYIKSGNSSFKRTIGKSSDSIVYESLYIKGVHKIEDNALF